MSPQLINFKTYPHAHSQEWLVMLHGAGGNMATWALQVPELKKHFNILLVDLRDHGKSKNIPPNPAEYDFNLISSDIIRVLDHLNIKKAHFMTLSFGSVLVQDLSMRYPDRVDKVIFAGGIFKGTLSLKLLANLARFLNLFLPYRMMYEFASWLLMPGKHHQKSRKIYREQSKMLKSSEYGKWIGLYREFFNVLYRFFREEVPYHGLVVMGSQDYVFLNAAKEFSSIQSCVQLEIIAGAGHICSIDEYMKFNQLSLRFLRG